MNLSAGSAAPETPNDPLEAGRSAFNGGDYFLAHELWEEVWREMPGPPVPAKRIVQGLIQIAAGCHHLREQRREPGVRLLEKGVAKLEVAITVAAAGGPLVAAGTSLACQASRLRAFAEAVRGVAASWSGAPGGAESDPAALNF